MKNKFVISNKMIKIKLKIRCFYCHMVHKNDEFYNKKYGNK